MVYVSCNESYLFVGQLHLLALQVRVLVWPLNLTQFFLRFHDIEIEANCVVISFIIE